MKASPIRIAITSTALTLISIYVYEGANIAHIMHDKDLKCLENQKIIVKMTVGFIFALSMFITLAGVMITVAGIDELIETNCKKWLNIAGAYAIINLYLILNIGLYLSRDCIPDYSDYMWNTTWPVIVVDTVVFAPILILEAYRAAVEWDEYKAYKQHKTAAKSN